MKYVGLACRKGGFRIESPYADPPTTSYIAFAPPLREIRLPILGRIRPRPFANEIEEDGREKELLNPFHYLPAAIDRFERKSYITQLKGED